MKLISKSKVFAQLIAILLLGVICFAQSSRAPGIPPASNSDKPLNILLKPEPVLTAEMKKRIAEREETVNLRIEFLDLGLIGAITPVDSPPPDLAAAAIEAAGRIKFEPEMKNGRRVTVYRVIEYNFAAPRANVENVKPEDAAKARAIIDRAVEKLGGQKYLQIRSHVGRGQFSIIQAGVNASFQTFTDVIVYPDKEITEFKQHGVKTVQANFGDTGWFFDEATEKLENQTAKQIDAFRLSMRVNLDNFLRGVRGVEAAQISYRGRRQAGIGKRNDVVRLTFDDGFWVEFEFSDDGFPAKSIYTKTSSEGREITEEDRFAQFVDVQGIRAPFIIDHFTGGTHTSRINYQSVEFRQSIPDSIFAKPDNIKAFKKDLKP